jgi:hypothetical protein
MRIKFTRALIPIAAFVAAAVLVGWLKGARGQGRQLEFRQRQEELRQLQAEHARLTDRLAEAGRRAAPRPVVEPAGDTPRPEEPPAAPALLPGEWTPSAAWRNEGRRTPRATIATLLWAAAGGDVRTWRDTLEFDDATERKARELLAGLSPVVRSQYASPDDLVASVAMTKVPLTEAQLMWLHQADADNAVAGLRLAGAERASGSVFGGAEVTVNAPPRLSDQSREKMVVLSLHRTAAGWRVVVPATAIERMARELAAPVAKR